MLLITVKRCLFIGLILAIIINSPLALSIPVSAATTAPTPTLKLENFKWQDILGDSFAIDPESGVSQLNKGYSLPGGKNPIVLNQICQTFLARFSKIAGTDSKGKPYGKSINEPGPSLQVRIFWSQDTKDLAQLAEEYFNNNAYAYEVTTKSNKFKLVSEEGSHISGSVLKVYWMQGTDSNKVVLVGHLITASPNALIHIMGYDLGSDFSEDEIAGILSRFEQRARDMLGLMSMDLTQYHPFAAKIASPHVGGDIVATLRNKGAPLQGQKVYFFLTKESSGLIYEPGCFVMPNMGAGFSANGPFAGLIRDYAVVETDKFGEATFNYIVSGALKPLLLGQMLDRHRELPAVFVITAVVFDRDPITYWNDKTTKEPQAQVMSEVTINFDSIARITKIITTDPVQFPKPYIQVKSPGKAYLPINAEQVNGVVSKPEGLFGYALNLNDQVFPSRYSAVMIQWLTGQTLLFTPKFDWDWANNGEVSILVGYKDSGMYDRINASAAYFWGMGATGFLGFVTSCKGLSVAAAPGWGVASAILGGIGLVGIAVSSYDRVTNPLIVQYKSQILFDLGETSTIYTVEGTATYYNSDSHTKVDVTTGRKMPITADGKEGTITTFKESELSSGMTSLLKTVRQQLPTASSTSTLNTKASASSSSLKPANNLPFEWVVIAGGGVLVLVVLVLLIKRKNRQTVSICPSLPVAPPPISGPVAARPIQTYQTDAPPIKAAGRFCSRCGSPAGVVSKYCGECGAIIDLPRPPVVVSTPSSQVVCLSCNGTNRSGILYCEHCGARLVSQSGTPANLQAPVQIKQKTSAAWWLMPIFLCWFGGLLAWAMVRGYDKGKARGLLWTGIGLTVLWLIAGIAISAFSYLVSKI